MLEYTRVTKVLRPFSGLDKIPEAVLKNAAERGSRVHQICDAIIEGIGYPDVELDIQGYINSFMQWYPKDFVNKPDRFFCDELMITGECDAIYKENGKLVLVDFKTPQKKSLSWPLQLSAYKYLAERAGYYVDYIEVVRLKKDGKAPEVIRYEDSKELFFHCLSVYRYFYTDDNQESYLDYL